MKHDYLHMDPFLTPDEAQHMLRIAESFGHFGTYAEEATSEGLGESLPQRFDVGLNYVARGLDGSGNADEESTAMSRTNYFRETYAYGDQQKVAGIEPFMQHAKMLAAAKQFSGCDHVVPAIVYANLLVPGQELAIHTDVPEFRGASRKNVPQWLLVCMLHSGLFASWRIPILTCVSWFGAAQGGAFTFYPDGPQGSRQAIAAQHNSAILVDTDTVFHGVERVDNKRPDLPEIGPGAQLHFLGADEWQLRNEGRAVANYSWPQIRYSISWKGYCFRDQQEQHIWESHGDDLNLEQILDVFEKELQRRGLLNGKRPAPDQFARLMVETFVHYPGEPSSAQ